MTKFKNRKGLALGSIFALVVSAFVGVAPAKAAAGDLIVEPAYGPVTNFTALASDSASISGIVLNTTYKTGVSAANLKYKVRILTADLDAASVSYQALVSESTAVVVPGLAGTYSAVTEAAYGDANYTYFDQTKVFYHTNGTLMGNASAYNLLRLAANRTDGETSSFQVEVTAWNDSVDNNMIDSSEVNTSVPVTVTFVHPEAVALGVAVTQPTLGDSTISARITMGGLNLQNYIEVAGGAPHIQAGVPLTSGFVAKFGIIRAAVSVESYALAVVAMLAAVIAAFLYLRIMVSMWLSDRTHSSEISASLSLKVAIALSVGVTLVIGFFPSLLLQYTNQF